MPDDLLRLAKRKAASEGRTLTSLIEEGLRTVVADRRAPAKAKHIMPRVSSATGGLMPEFAGMSYSELEELDDLEYAERMKHFNDPARR
ncbi:MAG: DUF2191 domain-containing protein [Alphaproteobacteria bacterium]|nr:DUF2191 domain-containing protein [Alphaproteobacteria bacterium]